MITKLQNKRLVKKPTQQMLLGSAYWKQQARKPIFTTELIKFNKRKAEESRQRIEEFKKWAATKGKGLAEKSQKDYLTTSNDNTWVENRNPMVKASKPKNPHLTERSVKGAKAHAAWTKAHPVLNTWGTVLGAAPFAVAAYPLAATAGSGIAALGDAAAATSAGQAAIAGLTPLTTAASTSIAGAPLYTWADAGLSSLFGAHGIQTAIDEGGVSPTTALEIAPLGRLAKPIYNVGKEGVQYATKAIDNAARYASPSYDLYKTVGETPIINRSFPTKSLYRANVYRGGKIRDSHNISLTTDPRYAEQYGKVTPYIFESKSIAKAKEPMMGYRDPVNNDMFIYRNTKDVPGANAIVGHDLVTGEFTPSKGVEILNMNPKNLYPIRTSDSPTSLKFFERRPSKLTEAEKFGLNKLDRKALSINELLALEDLALYKNSGQYRLVFRVTPDWENFGWNLDRSNPSFLLLFVKDGKSMRGSWARVVLQTPTGKGVLAVNPEKNMAGYTSRSFSVPEGMNWAPGEANMMIDGTNGLKIILTAPRTDFFDAIVEKGSESIGEKLPNIIDKNIMKDFWINSRKALRPGTYLSGDNGHAPKGSELIEAFKKRQLYKVDIKERPLNKLFVTRTGLSPDSYSSIIRQGNRDGSLRWGEGFNKWNNSAVENRFINEAFLKLQKGEITPEQYEEIFNNWSLSIGGRELLWKDFNGNKIPIHPHPYIYAKKQGGKIL